MRRRKIFRTTVFWLSVLSAVAFGAFSLSSPSAAGPAPLQDWQAKVDAGVLNKATLGQTEFLIYLAEKADLSGADALATKEEKGQYVYARLTSVAEASQAGVRQTLESLGAQYRPFWVSNAVWARSDLSVLEAVAQRPEVAYVYAAGAAR